MKKISLLTLGAALIAAPVFAAPGQVAKGDADANGTLTRAEALGLVWRLKQSIVYVMLERLEDEGYVTASIEPQGSRPPRKVLHLTPAGLAAFERWRVAPVAHGRDFRLEFLAKLFFARQNGPADAAALIAAQQAACRGWLAELRGQAEPLAGERAYDWLVL